MPKTNLDIDRKTASKILKVSIRTIDRHVRDGKLMARRENGRIWLNKKEVQDLFNPRKSVMRQSIDNEYPVYVHQLRPPKIQNADFYKDLYEETKNALHDYKQKLDQANYRIGQLESQLLHISSQKPAQQREDFYGSEIIRKDLIDREKELISLKELLKQEKLSRIVFSILTYALLLLLPALWYLLR